ncbi:hypothetical protein LCL89_05615 [Halobacillus yeomjeoni]|uniref:hypothetical protein n=1 Tax=Halobacillus yeomjeoni TaxID=311194 RepID=UPI001CD626E7|nr:hypothetical protein [Halobacillus yeomjeoni]MCA0983530.1 hypothetical protein [Halobacillus yeomjeoni]
MKIIYVERMRELYAYLELNQIQVNDIGQYNDVLIVNDTLVFRFPKYIKGIKKLEKEVMVNLLLKGV